MDKKQIIVILTLVLIVFVSVFVIGLSKLLQLQGREPNRYELAYQTIASWLEKPDMCYKISKQTVDAGAGFNPRGTQISYSRSSCFYTVALNAKNPFFCDEVKPLSTLSVDGSKISKEECQKMIQEGFRAKSGNGSFGIEGPRWLLMEMGYTEDMVPKRLKEEYSYDPRLYWYDYYLEISQTKEFQEKIISLPDFSN